MPKEHVRQMVVIKGLKVFFKKTGAFLGRIQWASDESTWDAVEPDTGKKTNYLLQRQAIAHLLEYAGLIPRQVMTMNPPGQGPLIFQVRMIDAGPQKIKVIKAIREVTGWPLKEAKNAADGLTPIFYETGSNEDAQQKANQVREAGAVVVVGVK